MAYQVEGKNLGFKAALLCGAVVAFTGQGQAQTSSSVAGITSALEEIVVTARKREESLQDAPISIQAFSADGLERRNITEVSEIGSFTPNLVFDSAAPIGGSNSSAVVFIRGVGQSTAVPTQDLGVGTYIDGVYLARSVGGVLDLVDVERIEVLRGPQGTLFGRNTIGGAISITSRKPSDVTEGDFEFTYGSDDRINIRGRANVPLSDELFIKAAAQYKNRDGYVVRPDGADLGDDNSLAGRFDVRWEPSDTFTVDLSLDGTRIRENGAPFELLEVVETAAFPQFHNAFVAPFGECFFGPGGPPSPIGNTNCYNSQWIDLEGRTDFGTFPAKDDLDLWGVSLIADWQVNENITVKSITSYRDSDSEFALDQDHSPLSVAEVESVFTQSQFSQELQVLGESFESRLQWILGLYYFTEEGDTFETVTFSPLFFRSGGSIDNDSLAAFAQASFDITDRLSLTVGGRYTEDDKRFTPDQAVLANNNDLVPPFLLGFGPGLVPPSPPPGTPILPGEEASAKFDKFTPMANLSYSWTDEVLTYFTYSEGFKSGGFTQRIFPPLPEVPTFEPETVEVFEIGLKSELADGAVRFNAAAFYTDYTDLQFTVQDVSVAPVVRNAGAATIKGFEIDVAAVPVDGLLIEGGIGFLDASYDEVDAGTGVTVDESLVKAPKWSTTLGIQYDFELADLGILSPRFDWSYTSSYENDAFNAPQIRQSGYHLLNLGLSFEDTSNGWRASIIGKNLTDERYISAGFSDTVSLGTSEAVRARGREWALTIGRSF